MDPHAALTPDWERVFARRAALAAARCACGAPAEPRVGGADRRCWRCLGRAAWANERSRGEALGRCAGACGRWLPASEMSVRVNGAAPELWCRPCLERQRVADEEPVDWAAGFGFDDPADWGDLFPDDDVPADDVLANLRGLR